MLPVLFKPDIVMVDPCFLGGAWWAEQHHVPYVHFGVLPMGLTSVDTAPFGLGILPQDSALGRLRNRALNWLVQHVLFADVQKYWNQLRVSVGMPTTGWFHDTAAKAHLFLQLASPGFEYPRRDLMPQAHFIGAMPVHRPANWQEPTWAATAVDANGGVHLALFPSDERHSDNPLGSPALYSYCPGPATACADPNKWSNWLSFSSQVSDVQIAITHDGHPRLLVTRRGSRADEYEYYACDTNCTQGGSWTGTFVVEGAGVMLNAFSLGNHYFALDAQDRPRFVYGNGWGNGQPDGIYYAWCDEADCTQTGSWQRMRAFIGPENKTTSGEAASLVFDGDKPRMVISRYTSGLPTGVLYLSCDADCDQHASWGSFEVTPLADRAWASWDLAIDANGHQHMVLFEPAPIDIFVGGALYYASCEQTDCSTPDSWQRTQIAAGEGKNADMVISPQGQITVVYDAGQRGVIGSMTCAAHCDQAQAWTRRIIETDAKLKQDFTPASPLSCSQQDNAWLDALPKADLTPTGQVVVAYDTRFVARCYTVDPSDPTHKVYTKIERIWWAVRWMWFQ